MRLSRRHAVDRSARWLMPAGLALGAGVSLLVAATAVSLRVARLVLTPPSERAEDIRVIRVDREAGTVALSRHPDAVIPGEYSLYFAQDRGYARVGDIVALSDRSVTRMLLAEVRGRLKPGLMARMSGWFFESPADIDVPHQEVEVSTSLGSAPAWLVPAENGNARWVIQVHGRGVDRREPIRAIPAFRLAGYTSLLISYRNDGLAPASEDGRYALGDVEWMDVDAAIRFAAEHGASEIVLMGWSMGGALVLQALTRSPHAELVRGLVLDSPVIDWVRVLDHQAGALKVPRVVRGFVYRLISRPWGGRLTGQAEAIDLERLDFVARASELTVPILLLHSEADSYVPPAGSTALAGLRPDIVTYARFDAAGHTRLWNYDSVKWERAIIDWLATLGRE